MFRHGIVFLAMVVIVVVIRSLAAGPGLRKDRWGRLACSLFLGLMGFWVCKAIG